MLSAYQQDAGVLLDNHCANTCLRRPVQVERRALVTSLCGGNYIQSGMANLPSLEVVFLALEEIYIYSQSDPSFVERTGRLYNC